MNSKWWFLADGLWFILGCERDRGAEPVARYLVWEILLVLDVQMNSKWWFLADGLWLILRCFQVKSTLSKRIRQIPSTNVLIRDVTGLDTSRDRKSSWAIPPIIVYRVIAGCCDALRFMAPRDNSRFHVQLTRAVMSRVWSRILDFCRKSYPSRLSERKRGGEKRHCVFDWWARLEQGQFQDSFCTIVSYRRRYYR